MPRFSVDDKMPFMEHLGELRTRIMRSLFWLLGGTLVALFRAEQITDYLSRPVTKLGYKLVFTAPAEAFWVQMKVALIVGLFLAAPGILWQVWAFIAPGLHQHERKYARETLQPMITLENHIDFLLKFTLAFGAVFELPLVITLLARMGVVTAKQLSKNRKYAILGAFIAGAVLTPTPDAFNQTLMAGPLILLYEVGIVCARIFGRATTPVVQPSEAPGG